jgi:hypothetical protein
MPVKIKKKSTKSSKSLRDLRDGKMKHFSDHKKGIDINNVIKILINNGTKKNKKSKSKTGGSSENINNLLVNKAISDNNSNKLIQTILLAMKDKPNDKNTIENIENRTIVRLLNSGNYQELSRIYPKIKAPLEKLVKDLNDTGDQLMIEQSKKDKLLIEFNNVKKDYEEQEYELKKMRKDKTISELEKNAIDKEINFIREQLNNTKEEYNLIKNQKDFTESELNKSLKILDKQNKHIEKVNNFFDEMKQGIKEDINNFNDINDIKSYIKVNKEGEEFDKLLKQEIEKLKDETNKNLKKENKNLGFKNTNNPDYFRKNIAAKKAIERLGEKILDTYTIKFDDEPYEDEETKDEKIIFEG